MRTERKAFLVGQSTVVIALTLLLAPAAHALDRFCAPNVAGWPAGAPTTDGNVASDLGYATGYRYVFANGTNDPHAAVQAIKAPDNSSLYLSVEVLNDAGFDTDNVFVVAFDSAPATRSTVAGPYRRFDIFPTSG